MKFKMLVSDQKSPKGWWEGGYDVPEGSDMQQAARILVNNYNSSRLPHEYERTLLDVAEDTDGSDDAPVSHDWEKDNLATHPGGYDKMKCRNCGITGKRYGLGSGVSRNRKYHAKVYGDCRRTQEHLKKGGDNA